MNVHKGGQSAVKLFFQENKTLAFSLPVLFILLIVVIVIYSTGGGGKAAVPVNAESSAGQARTIEILPNTERVDASGDSTGGNSTDKNSTDENSKGGNAAIKNPFSGPIILSGVLTDSDGDNIAVIEANNKSYIVKKGDTLEGSVTVDEISADGAILKNGDREIDLKLERRKNNQTVIN